GASHYLRFVRSGDSFARSRSPAPVGIPGGGGAPGGFISSDLPPRECVPPRQLTCPRGDSRPRLSGGAMLRLLFPANRGRAALDWTARGPALSAVEGG